MLSSAECDHISKSTKQKQYYYQSVNVITICQINHKKLKPKVTKILRILIKKSCEMGKFLFNNVKNYPTINLAYAHYFVLYLLLGCNI